MSAGQEKSGVPDIIKYEPLFSFFDYYQDFINDLGYYADPEGKTRIFFIFCFFRSRGNGPSQRINGN